MEVEVYEKYNILNEVAQVNVWMQHFSFSSFLKHYSITLISLTKLFSFTLCTRPRGGKASRSYVAFFPLRILKFFS